MSTDERPVLSLRSGERTHELAAVLLLLRLPGLSGDRITAAIEEHASAVSVLQDVDAEALVTEMTPEDVSRAIQTAAEWRLKKYDVRLAIDDNYPRNLLAIFNRPPFVFVRGTWDERRDSISVAIVGTRNPSPDGLKRADSVARAMARAGITVLSGLAKGIDTAAHSAVLSAGGRTVAVIGTGIDRMYPPENASLAAEIVNRGGAIISQFVPLQPPTRWSFPMRNVVMSGLSLATIVIEASETSGAKLQARAALEHGRTVFLPKSLVTTHPWAERMVERGVKGVKAIQVDSTDDIVDRINSSPGDLDELAI